MDRCVKCILPSNYPGINFSDNGVCNFCNSYKKKNHLGAKILDIYLKKYLQKTKNNALYDCVVSFSGGRDSSYLIWYLKKNLNLSIIAYSVDNGFVSDVAKRNMNKISHKLGIEFVVEKKNYLLKCYKHHLNSFLAKPSPAMIGMLCVGCKLGIKEGGINFAKKNKIPLLVSGGSPLEVGTYKLGLLRNNPKSKKRSSLIKGYFNQIKNNPRWIMNPLALYIQFKEFNKYYRKGDPYNVKRVNPYYEFIHWNEKEFCSTLKNEVNWEHNNKKNNSTWKTDCYIAPLRKYLYRKMLCFNDIDDHLSALVRDEQITRNSALRRLKIESTVPDELINQTCIRLCINRTRMEEAINRYKGAVRTV